MLCMADIKPSTVLACELLAGTNNMCASQIWINTQPGVAAALSCFDHAAQYVMSLHGWVSTYLA